MLEAFSMTNSLKMKCPVPKLQMGLTRTSVAVFCLCPQTIDLPVSLFFIQFCTLVFHLPHPYLLYSPPLDSSSTIDLFLSWQHLIILSGNLTLCLLPWPWSFLPPMLFEGGNSCDFHPTPTLSSQAHSQHVTAKGLECYVQEFDLNKMNI